MSDRQLTKLSNKHKQLARLLVQGHTQSEAAKLIGLHKSTVCRLMREPLLINEIHRLQEKADNNASSCVPGLSEQIKEGAHRGIEELLKILDDERIDSEILRIKKNAACELLSRAGYGPIKQVQVDQRSISMQYITKEDLESLQERALEVAAQNGIVKLK